MQYLKEMPNGNRVPVPYRTFLVDSYDKQYTQIIAVPNLIIYRVGGAGTRPASKPLKYGGRGNPKSPIAYRGN